MRMGDQLDVQMIRGGDSWTYFTVVLGIAVAIESAIVGMTPSSWLPFPLNVLTFLVLVGLTIWRFIESEWLHDKLLGFKARYEGKAR